MLLDEVDRFFASVGDWIPSASGWTAIFTAIGILTAVRAILKTRTSQGAIAWTMGLILLPVVSVPLYWIFGRSRFYGYVRAHRTRRVAVRETAKSVESRMREERRDVSGFSGTDSSFERLSPHCITGGNCVELLIDGEETFEAIFDAIRRAEKYILVEFFVLRDDDLGSRLADLLIDRARSGVSCSVLFDQVGSRKISRKYIRALEEAGVEIAPFSTTRGMDQLLQINFRNHRKIVVVDGQVAFTGGLNVGDEYLGEGRDKRRWRDTHLRFSGPMITTVQLAFLEDWNWAVPDGTLDLDWSISPSEEADMPALVVPSGPADEFETCGLMYIDAIGLAKERVWIATPYFVPDPPAVTALQLAALRGVDVRVLIPDSSDSILADAAAHTFYEELLPYGVKIFRYGSGLMHQKVMLVDQQFASVGTANFDNRSFRLNFELSVLCFDATFVARVRQMLEDDLAKSAEVDLEQDPGRRFLFNLGCRLSRLAASIQ